MDTLFILDCLITDKSQENFSGHLVAPDHEFGVLRSAVGMTHGLRSVL